MIWDLESGRNVYAFDCGSRVMATCFSKDVTLLASTSYTGAACVWSLEDGSMKFEMQMCPGPVFCVQLTRTGESHVITTGDSNGWATIRGIDLKGQNQRRAGVKGGSAVRCLSLSDDLELLGTGHQSGQVLLWNVGTEKPVWSMSCGAIVYSMEMSLDKRLLVTGKQNTLGSLDTPSTGTRSSPDRTAPNSSPNISHRNGDAAPSPHQQLGQRWPLIAGDQVKNAKVWSAATGLLICTLQCNDFVKRVDLSNDSEILATGSGDTCNIWDLRSGLLIFSDRKGGRVTLAGVSGR
jgi:WD40 repeat protein